MAKTADLYVMMVMFLHLNVLKGAIDSMNEMCGTTIFSLLDCVRNNQ